MPTERQLDPSVVTIAEALKAGGYVTANIGKWHLGEGELTGPQAQGFNVNVGGGQTGKVLTHFSPYKTQCMPDGPRGEYLTDRPTEEAVRFIEANQHQPFFLYLSHYAVHTPVQAPPELTKKYEAKQPSKNKGCAVYAAMIESIDQSVGRVMDALERLGLDENTVVVFYSDNGGHPGYTSMAPLRSAKGAIYEGGIRVPLAVRWPGVIRPSACATRL